MRMGARSLVFCLLLVLCVSGCASGDKGDTIPDDAFRVYVLDNDRTGIVPQAYDLQADRADTNAAVEEVACALQAAPLTEDVVLREYHLEDGLLTLDFDVRYLDLDPATEALSRAAIVRTFTGIDGVDSVLFLVSGTALMKNETEPVGVMSADSFVMSDLP